MSSRIAERFRKLKERGQGAFIPFITAGDPDLETTERLIVGLDRIGADVIELGVPFSDPMADGPVIQRASERALHNNFGLREVLDMLRQAQRRREVPIVLFSYYNPLLQFGLDRLGEELAQAGVDGVLVTDLVPEEASAFVATMRGKGIDTIFLIAPTSTDERIKLIARMSTGFIYAVSRTGVTGMRETISETVPQLVRRVRLVTQLPIAVGFGISRPEQVKEVWQYADGAVVGSAIVAEIEKNIGNPYLVEKVCKFASFLRGVFQTARATPGNNENGRDIQ